MCSTTSSFTKLYDFIIIGAGAAGLSLAYHLANSPLQHHSILVVDRSLKGHVTTQCPRRGFAINLNPSAAAPSHTQGLGRTWAFWANAPTPFDDLALRTWRQFLVATYREKRILQIDPYQYKVIRGADFYRFAYEELSRLPNVEFMQGKVEEVEDGIECACIYAGGQIYQGRWVFDSRFRLADFHPDLKRYHYLKMQCRGWELEAPNSSFDPQTPTFLDFRVPQKEKERGGGLRFFYVLPYSESRALVEYVICTEKLLCRAEQEEALRGYLENVLRIPEFRVLAEEQGANPMTDYPFPRRVGRRIMRIGIAGGMLKPTTGFAFIRIQHDSAAIVQSLLTLGNPFKIPAYRRAYRLCDSLILHGMAHHGGQMPSLLATFFKYGSTHRILRFLDERGAPF